MIFDDVDFAKDILIRENYFVSGYRHLFLKSPGIEVLLRELLFENYMRCLILIDK